MQTLFIVADHISLALQVEAHIADFMAMIFSLLMLLFLSSFFCMFFNKGGLDITN